MNFYAKNLAKPQAWPLLKRTLLVMKLTTLIIIIAFVQVSAKTYSQVTLKEKNATLEKVIKSIKAQTGYFFVYSDQEIKTDPITVDLKNATIEQALQACFDNQPVTYKVVDKNIILQPKDKDKSVISPLIDIRGKVVDENGQPLPGATIKIIGQGYATTNEKGEFNILSVDRNAILEISFIGYQKLTLKASDNLSLIKLIKNDSKLDEVQIIGYGTSSERLNTGSVTSVKSVDIQKQPVENTLSAMQGRMPGVFISNGLGLPGSNVNIQIRGLNSLQSGNLPLFIVDGVPYPGTPLNQFDGFLAGANGYLSPLNAINPSDIESIDVLKDADATAIYGSRGANGVVLITTRKGKSGKTKLDANIYSGNENANDFVKTLNTQQYLEITKEGFANDGVTPTINNAPQLLTFDQNKYTDFQKYIFGKTAKVTDASLNISGGNDNTNFLVGGNFRNEGTVQIGSSGYSRAGLHFNIEHLSPNKKFHALITSNFSSDDNNSLTNSIASLQLPPNFPLYNAAGNLNWVKGSNPIAFSLRQSNSQTKNLITNGELSYKIFPDLTIKTNVGYNWIVLNTVLTIPESSLNPAAFIHTNSATYGSSDITTKLLEPQLNYFKQLGNGKLEALLGGTYQYTNTSGYTIQGQNYSNDGLLKSLTNAGIITGASNNNTDYKYASVFARLNYNLADKYIINGSFRRDGSTRFGPYKEFGNFGAGGVAWIFSNEDFIKDNFKSFSFGKLRASYGIVGNDQIPDYQYLSTYGNIYNYQGISGLEPTRIANPNYSWEINKKLEFGLDLGFFNNRILFTGSWFRNISNNQLVGFPLPSQTGFSSYQANLPANVKNTGIEISFTTTNIKNTSFSWNSSFNISFLNNKLVSYPNLASSPFYNTYVVGQPITVIKAFHFTHIDSQTGLPLFSTASGIDASNPNSSTDRQVIGSTMPKYYGGLSNSFKYKNISLDFLLQFVNQKGFSTAYWPGRSAVLPAEAMARWQKPGDVTSVPVATSGYASNAAGNAFFAYVFQSDRFFGDASYVRMKNVSLSYCLPQELLKKFNVSQLRIYLQGQNLLTFTKYKGQDPELATVSSISYTVPTLRIITMGLQITL